MLRLRLQVTGIVQGVGFRPFVYRLARDLALAGFVLNDAEGVEIEIEGASEALAEFEDRLFRELPPLARIDTLEREEIPLIGDSDFRILDSQEGSKSVAVTPDMAICDACLEEMRDPSNRRYRHPFITCTDCGPRYSIIRTVPYDRPNTSMASFAMCPKCQSEYDNPLDRRYHAQPIACPECGPTLSLWLKEEDALESRAFRRFRGGDAAISELVELVKRGKVVAVKGLGGFHLICDASNEAAVRLLRERKNRPAKPFAVMVKDMKSAKALAQMNEAEERLLTSKERPIVLLKKRPSDVVGEIPLADSVAPGIDRIGIMLPYTPLHCLLFEALEIPLVATSANLSDEPIIRARSELEAKLGHVVEAILDHDREIVNACDDSVAQVVGGRIQWLRLARGVAPLTLPLERANPLPILAVGAQQKNTLALALEERIVLSPHIGDLHTIEAMEYFERSVETFRRFYDVDPRIIVHDKHPGYATVAWSQKQSKRDASVRTLGLQHHYAHALAVMAEHGLRDRKCLAFVWDGTGYGEDGTIWGGETLLADGNGFERIASLRPFRLSGGERAVREPRRVALAMLFELFALDEILEMETPTIRAFDREEIQLLHQAWSKGINAPVTSSMGRLFDAVASLAGLCQYQSYEGQSGLLLEAAAGRERGEETLEFVYDGGVLDWEPALRRILAGDISVATGLMEGLARSVEALAAGYPDLPVILAGGVFQNRTLVEAIMKRLPDERLLLPRRVPPNDAAVALGQAWWGIGVP
ncbi:carbamoyltransferase HypF [Nitratifractor sp.]